jgi:hypothetical protein
VKWWPWYKSKFGRSRRDAEKIMKLAGAEDPEEAHDEEKAQAVERMRRNRSAANVRRGPELQDDNRVERILRLIDQLNQDERTELLRLRHPRRALLASIIQRTALLDVETPHHRRSVLASSLQSGRTTPPTCPHLAHFTFGPNDLISTLSRQSSAFTVLA